MVGARQAICRNGDFKTRAADGNLYIEGYFATFTGEYRMWDKAVERIDREAFDGTLGDDIRALVNHDTTIVLGRTTSGTLTLRVDDGRLLARLGGDDHLLVVEIRVLLLRKHLLQRTRLHSLDLHHVDAHAPAASHQIQLSGDAIQNGGILDDAIDVQRSSNVTELRLEQLRQDIGKIGDRVGHLLGIDDVVLQDL